MHYNLDEQQSISHILKRDDEPKYMEELVDVETDTDVRVMFWDAIA